MGENCIRENVSIMIEEFVKESLAQDVGRGDLYALVEDAIDAKADIIAKSDGVFAGRSYVEVLAKLENLDIIWTFKDGDRFFKKSIFYNNQLNIIYHF